MLDECEAGARFNLAERRGLCPICGQLMTEADRLKEGSHIFIWFKCIRQECGGQWLQRRVIRQNERVEKMPVDSQQRIPA
jgi:hypothetical protein